MNLPLEAFKSIQAQLQITPGHGRSALPRVAASSTLGPGSPGIPAGLRMPSPTARSPSPPHPQTTGGRPPPPSSPTASILLSLSAQPVASPSPLQPHDLSPQPLSPQPGARPHPPVPRPGFPITSGRACCGRLESSAPARGGPAGSSRPSTPSGSARPGAERRERTSHGTRGSSGAAATGQASGPRTHPFHDAAVHLHPRPRHGSRPGAWPTATQPRPEPEEGEKQAPAPQLRNLSLDSRPRDAAEREKTGRLPERPDQGRRTAPRSRQPADCACACARRGAALKGAAPRLFPRIRSFPRGTLAATGELRDEVRNESPEDLYPKRRKPHRLQKACFTSSWILQLSRRLVHLCLPRFSPGPCGTQNWRFLELKM